MNITRLLSRAKAFPLFANCGKQSTAEVRISQWEEWAGPEEPRAMEVSMRMQELHDRLVPVAEEPGWKQALQMVVAHTRHLVPYVEGEDAFYAPNIAVWEAAWVLSLEELHLSKAISIPASIQAQIYWYQRGHWPCELVSLEQGDLPEHYVVY